MQSQLQSLDTTGNSLLHKLVRQRGPEGVVRMNPFTGPFAWASMLGYLPFLILACTRHAPWTDTSQIAGMTFFEDLPFAFLMLVSFPVLLSLTLDDQRTLVAALCKLEERGIVRFKPDLASKWRDTWSARFRRINVWAQGFALAIGGAVTVANYGIYSKIEPGYWIAESGRLLPEGYLFLAGCFAFYATIPIFVIRSVSMSVMMQSLVRHAEIKVVPFHPDRCAGLSPAGSLGMRNQVLLTVIGMNVVLLWFISFSVLCVPPELKAMIVIGAAAYIVCGPSVFVGPMLPFRDSMLRAKAELIRDIAARIQREFSKLNEQLKEGGISAEDHESLERLRELGDSVNALPVWPFDWNTLKQFVSAYLLPVATAFGFTQLDWIGALLGLG